MRGSMHTEQAVLGNVRTGDTFALLVALCTNANSGGMRRCVTVCLPERNFMPFHFRLNGSFARVYVLTFCSLPVYEYDKCIEPSLIRTGGHCDVVGGLAC